MPQTILLGEDSATDEKLALPAFKKSETATRIVVAHDGAEALDSLLGSRGFTDRDVSVLFAVVLPLTPSEALGESP